MFGVKNRLDADAMTLIGEEAYFHGTLAAKGSLRVEGVLEGDVSDAFEIQVGVHGRIVGSVTAETVIVAGEVEGNITASRSLELLSGARVRGDVRAPSLRMDEGARLNGVCAMEETGEEVRAG